MSPVRSCPTKPGPEEPVQSPKYQEKSPPNPRQSTKSRPIHHFIKKIAILHPSLPGNAVNSRPGLQTASLIGLPVKMLHTFFKPNNPSLIFIIINNFVLITSTHKFSI